MKHDDAYLEYLRQGFLRAGYADLLPHDMDRGARDWERYYLGFAGSFNYFPISRTEFVAMTGDVQRLARDRPADECTCLDQPQWCASCLKRIEAWRGCPEPETDDQLDSRNVNPIHTIKPPAHVHCYMAPDWACSCGHTWKQKEQAEGIARALRRLCDGAEYRSGCADYEPER
jgi:hypothetical protein